ncbi:neuropeptide-like 4 [Anastrepha obliqua]|uniref:neuropeptide-like 4 n=1 Tax=Anastrepha obliqua TaxID=95512 RepID=UPI00240A17BF|nr:neuropeptide-like 4 [Anastrepha obliqua]
MFKLFVVLFAALFAFAAAGPSPVARPAPLPVASPHPAPAPAPAPQFYYGGYASPYSYAYSAYPYYG